MAEIKRPGCSAMQGKTVWTMLSTRSWPSAGDGSIEMAAPSLNPSGLRAVIVRTWQIRLARHTMKAGNMMLTLAELLLPDDLRR